MISLIQSMFDKTPELRTDSNMSLQTKEKPRDELRIVPSSFNNHGIEVEELSFEDVARIMAGK